MPGGSSAHGFASSSPDRLRYLWLSRFPRLNQSVPAQISHRIRNLIYLLAVGTDFASLRGTKRSGLSFSRCKLVFCLMFLMFGSASASECSASDPTVTSLDYSFQQSLLEYLVTLSVIVALLIPALYVLHALAVTAVNFMCVCSGFCFHTLKRCLCCCPALIPLVGCTTCFAANTPVRELVGVACFCLSFTCRCLIGSIESLLSFALPSLAPMRVMCIAGFGLAAAGHLVSWYLSPKVCAKRRVMLMCRKIGLHRYRQCRRASWSPHRLCHAVDLVEYQIHMSHVNAYFHSLHEMHHLRGGGGGGGAHVTKRKRNQKELLLGLKELLEKFTEPNEKVSPKKSKKSDTLLDALQKTVTRAQQNPRNLLQSLTQLVQRANGGKIRIDDPALASGPNKQPKPAAPKSIPKQQNPKPTWADKVKSGTPPNESAPAMRLWTPPDTRESIATVNQIRQTLENGYRPTASLVAMTYTSKCWFKLMNSLTSKLPPFYSR